MKKSGYYYLYFIVQTSKTIYVKANKEVNTYNEGLNKSMIVRCSCGIRSLRGI